MIQVRPLSDNEIQLGFPSSYFKRLEIFLLDLNQEERDQEPSSDYKGLVREWNQQKIEEMEMGGGKDFDYIICGLYLVYLKPNLSSGYCQ